MDVMRAEAEVSRRDQDLTVAKTNLQLQESLIKNALTKNLDDPTLEAMPVIPTDTLDTVQVDSGAADAGTHRGGVARPAGAGGVRHRSAQPRDQRKAATNALLPTLALVGFYGGTGLAGR